MSYASRRSPSLAIETITETQPRAVQQYAYVIARLADEVANLGRRQFLDLAKMEDLALQRWKAVEALPHGETGLSGCRGAIRRDRRSNPPATRIEARLEALFERLRTPPGIAATFLDLVMKDPEEKRAHFRSALEPIEAREKRQEYVLDDVLGLRRFEAHTTRGAIQTPRMIVDDRGKGCWISPLKACEQFGIASHVLHVTP